VTVDDAAISAAAALLRAGGLVAFPTETVYGLGAEATSRPAVRRIFAVKGRPTGHPLIVHLPDARALPLWASDVRPAAEALAEACWPGPLTIVVRRGPRVSDLVTGGLETVGLRVPAHPMALALLHALGPDDEGAMAAPSANRFGRVSPTTADHVRADLGDDVDLVLDGGPCAVGVESTIVDATTDPVTVLRRGAVTVERLTDILGGPVAHDSSGAPRAPGMLPSHYAPLARVELAADAATARARADALRAAGGRAGVLAPSVDPATYAERLYGWLRAADADALDVLVVVPPPDDGIGAAVVERLRKAAAPRLSPRPPRS
jgi:L-threonylcarbamoyladenylate synthase